MIPRMKCPNRIDVDDEQNDMKVMYVYLRKEISRKCGFLHSFESSPSTTLSESLLSRNRLGMFQLGWFAIPRINMCGW